MTSHAAHLRLTVLGLTAVVVLTACSDSTSGAGAPAGAGGTSGSSGSATSSAAVRPAANVGELALTLAKSAATGTTVHIAVSTSGGGTTADAAGNGEGDVRTAAGGKAEAFQFSVGSGSSAISLVYVDGTGYVKLPPAQRTDQTKPWAKVSATSTNPVVKAVATGFDQIGSQTSLAQYATLVKSASNFRATGPTDVDGTSAQGYAFDVDPQSLPTAKDLGAAVAQIGPIPTTMAVDQQGRPLQVVEKISVQQQDITTTVTYSDYGKDVDIAAPPADQVSAD